MKKIILFTVISFFINVITSYAQDIIYKTDGSQIKAKVIEITTETVKYKKFDQQNGPIRNILISDVFMIIYEDGTREVFKKQDNNRKNSENQVPQNNPASENQSTTIQNENNSNYQQSTTNTTTDNNESNNTSEVTFLIGGKVGFLIPYSTDMIEIYGSGFMWGVHTSLWFDKNAIALDLRSFGKDGNPYVYTSGQVQVDNASCHIDITPLTLSYFYKFPETKTVITYGGGGIGLGWIHETLSMTVSGDTYTDETNITRFEFHTTGGIRISPIYFEITFSSIPYSGGDFGGIIIAGGLIF